MAGNKNFNVNIAVIPEPYKDLDELLRDDSAKAKKILKTPIPVYDFFLATALKRNNKETALGKKAIMEELVPVFSRISNRVVFEHYAKQLSSELDISENTVFSMLEQKKSSKNTEYPEFEDFGQKFPLKDRKIEGYLISLLLKAPLEKSKEIVKKLKKEDFLNENLADVFEKLENYLEDRKSEINVKAFINKFEDEQKNLISELYMWDSDEDEENNEFPKNIEKSWKRCRKE